MESSPSLLLRVGTLTPMVLSLLVGKTPACSDMALMARLTLPGARSLAPRLSFTPHEPPPPPLRGPPAGKRQPRPLSLRSAPESAFLEQKPGLPPVHPPAQPPRGPAAAGMDLCAGALVSSLPQRLSSSLLVVWTRFFPPCSLQGFPRSVSPNPRLPRDPPPGRHFPSHAPSWQNAGPGHLAHREGPKGSLTLSGWGSC